MTEIGITSLELSRRKKYLLEGYVGSPITNVEYRLNEDGELLVRGRATARIIVENGVNIPAVCRSIMSEVRYVVTKNTGVPVQAVDVCVDSMTL